MKYIGIIGTRRRNSIEAFKRIKEKFFELYQEGDTIVSGGCPKGGGRFAEKLAIENDIPMLIFYPDWINNTCRDDLIRNNAIAKQSDVLIACVAYDRTGETENTIKNFIKKYENETTVNGVKLHIIE